MNSPKLLKTLFYLVNPLLVRFEHQDLVLVGE
jgi:hypothetical protein